jgi:predicted oxidoreductase
MMLATATELAEQGKSVVLLHGEGRARVVIRTELRDGRLYLKHSVPGYARLGLLAREGRYELEGDAP